MGISDRRIDYQSPGLDVTDLDPDPVRQWWRWYEEVSAAGADEPNAAALATVAPDGSPDCRFVIVRGADERGFSFYTNLTSPKAAHLAARPQAALTFGWPALFRQVRVRGAVSPVPDAEADDYFASRPRGSQVGAWASPQSQVIESRAWLDARVAEVEARYDGVDVPRPPHWSGYLVHVGEVEFWQGQPSRLHDRFRYRPGPDGWAVDRLSP